MTVEAIQSDIATSYRSAAEEPPEVASFLHGVIGLRLGRHLGNFLDEQELGFVAGPATDFAIPEIGTKRPDVSFVSAARMAEPIDAEVPFAPDLAAEVISRTDDWSAIVARAWQYLEVGTRLVWVIDPYTKSVFIFRAGRTHQMLTLEDELDGEDVIPGFRLPVSKVFR